ncbi:MAG: hypothetical protein IBJ03_04320 [Gemmatimonadaceae bacterium]|nr:hypothetical protein [Gemmatimonadaceae bacterium]
MTTSPVTRAIESVARQLTRRHALIGATIGLAFAALLELVPLVYVPLDGTTPTAQRLATHGIRAVLLAGIAGALFVGLRRARRSHTAIISLLEQLLPRSRNLLFTAWELESSNASSSGDNHATHQLVRERAAQVASTVNAAALLPLAPYWQRLALASAAWLITAWLVTRIPTGVVDRAVRQSIAGVAGTVDISRIDVSVVEPAYAGRASRRLRNPTRLEALEGSTIEVTVASTGTSLTVTTDSGEVIVRRPASGDFVWKGTITRDGFLAVTARAEDTTRARVSRTLGILAQHDAAPSARVVQPGRDLIVDSARRSLSVTVEATDDLALRSLSLLYTKVSGAGERFTFTEGQAPIQLERSAATRWSARAVLPLDSLLGEPGDLLVYRARVTDGRPGAEPVESDAYIAERLPDGGVAAAGFALDPDEDRYAVSQQMVILKTERLIAARNSLSPTNLSEQSRALGNEQRRVRAEFVFMTGGEFEQALVVDEDGMADLDESHEAESEGDLADGRMVNRGRAALMTAIRAMSRAALALNESDLTNALRYERTALANLQEAFARQRFLMRALSQREQLDLSRRLTGSLDSVSRATRAIPQVEPDTRRLGVRSILQDLSARKTGSPALGSLAIRVLQLEPGSARTQRIADLLQRANVDRVGTRQYQIAMDSASLLLSEWFASLTAGGQATTRSPELRAIDASLQKPAQEPVQRPVQR